LRKPIQSKKSKRKKKTPSRFWVLSGRWRATQRVIPEPERVEPVSPARPIPSSSNGLWIVPISKAHPGK
jgi:hypothetical protein